MSSDKKNTQILNTVLFLAILIAPILSQASGRGVGFKPPFTNKIASGANSRYLSANTPPQILLSELRPPILRGNKQVSGLSSLPAADLVGSPFYLDLTSTHQPNWQNKELQLTLDSLETEKRRATPSLLDSQNFYTDLSAFPSKYIATNVGAKSYLLDSPEEVYDPIPPPMLPHTDSITEGSSWPLVKNKKIIRRKGIAESSESDTSLPRAQNLPISVLPTSEIATQSAVNSSSQLQVDVSNASGHPLPPPVFSNALNVADTSSGSYVSAVSRSEEIKSQLLQQNRAADLTRFVTRAVSSRLENAVSYSDLVAAGQSDYFKPNSFWVSGFVGSDSYKIDSKANSRFVGGSVGYDFFINDVDIVGLAFSRIYGKTSAPTVKSENYASLASLYGLFRFEHIVINTSAMVGFANVENVRMNHQADQTKSTFDNLLYGVNATVGYKVKSNSHIFTPFVGLAYSGNNQNSYQEQGHEPYSFKKASGRNMSSIMAVKYEYLIYRDETYLIPKLTVGFSKDLLKKPIVFSARSLSNGEDFNIKSNASLSQNSVFIAPGIVAKNDYITVDLSYTMERSEGFIGHVGCLKMSVKF